MVFGGLPPRDAPHLVVVGPLEVEQELEGPGPYRGPGAFPYSPGAFVPPHSNIFDEHAPAWVRALLQLGPAMYRPEPGALRLLERTNPQSLNSHWLVAAGFSFVFKVLQHLHNPVVVYKTW